MAKVGLKRSLNKGAFTMSAEQNMAISRNFLEAAWGKKDVGGLGKYVADDHAAHGPFTDQLPPGLQGVQAFASTFTGAFPDVTFTIDSQEADGDLVRTQVTYHGTHKAELMGIPATNRTATVPVLITDRIAGGKIAESWAEWDPDDMMRQLGVG
jgi:predicted ester cyclase